MALRFDEAKATQTAAMFLALRGGRMHYIKLIKLLYLLDRAALLDWGVPVTTDRYVSMDDGPVVSNIYNLIVRDQPKPAWAQYISPPMGDYEVELRTDCHDLPKDRLSVAEERLIRQIYEEHGHKNRWALIEYVHTLPEWKNPYGTSIPIHIREILKAGGETEEEIAATLKELRIAGASEDSIPSV